jgi:hypothetical protein
MGQVVAVANVLTQRLSNQSDTSSSSIAIGTGNKTFVTAGFYEWAVGMWVTVTSAANPANYMFGQVTSWTTSTNTLIVDVDSVGGSGTLSDWTIALSAYSAIGDYLTDADIGVTVQPYDADTPTVAASKAEMEAGTETAIRSMSPLRVAEAVSALVSGRNKIINGAMMIDQRNAGTAVTPSTLYSTYTLDRWNANYSVASKYSVQQTSTAPTGFINSLKATATSSYTVASSEGFWLSQAIEGLNCTDLAWGTASAKTVTLSFWVYSSLTGTFGGSFTNSAQNRSYPFSYTISSANTWEQKTVTVAGDTSGTWLTTNGIGIQLFFGLGVGSTYSGTAGSWAGSLLISATGATSVVGTNGATFYITGVQLEKGATATPFENRLYGTELALCQRYYYKATAGTAFNQLAFCNVRTTTSHYAFLQLPVTMRGNPSSVDYNGVGVIASWGAGVTGLNSLALANATYGAGTTQVLLDAVTSGAVGTVGQVSALLGNNNASAYVALNAEL